MAKYHGEGDRQSPIVQLEYEEMRRKFTCYFPSLFDAHS